MYIQKKHRKFEFISNVLFDIGFNDLADEAKEIDTEIRKHYNPDEDVLWTNKFTYKMNSIKIITRELIKIGDIKFVLLYMERISVDIDLCYPCHFHGRKGNRNACKNCRFGVSMGGICRNPNSKHSQFHRKLHQLAEKYY